MAITIDQKRLTKQSIFNYIYYSKEPVSKPQIAAALDLSLPTVYKNITELLDEGMIVLGEVLKSTGGRPPVAYVSNKEYCWAMSIAIARNKLRYYAANGWREEICYKDSSICSLNLEEIGQQINRELPEFIKDCGMPVEKLIGLGITIPGVINPDRTEIILSPTLDLRNADIEKLISQIPVSVPIIVENDTTSASYGEIYSMPIDQRDKTFAYLFLEYGVGGAIYMDGKAYYGKNHRSAEFGHVKVGNEGLPCSCGNIDCLEAYIGAGRFTKNLGITIEEFMDKVRVGEEEYRSMWLDSISHLAVGINAIRMHFDCDIILGGFMTEYLDDYLPYLKQELSALDPFQEDAEYLLMGSFAKKAGVRGLTTHILTEYLENI